MNEAIKISGLKKSYGTHVVLNGLDFCVRQGEIFALLGVNGAGKTTSLECIEGLRKYDSGNITIHGRIGIQLQSSNCSPNGIKLPLTKQCLMLSAFMNLRRNSIINYQQVRSGDFIWHLP